MIKILPDLAAPAVVAAADIVTKKVAPTYNEWVNYGLTAIGYLAGAMNWGRGDMNDFLKNLGVASLPLTANLLYTRITTPTAARVGSRMALHPMSSMGRIGQSTFSEFQDVRIS